MAIFQLPVNPQDKKQLTKKISILREVVPPEHRKGLLLYPGMSLRDISSTLIKIKQNVNTYCPTDFVITLHAPFSPHTPNPLANLAHKESLEMFQKTIKCAEAINAGSITIHFGTNMYHPSKSNFDEKLRWRFRNVEEIRTNLVEPAFSNLSQLAESTSMNIGVENMPIPLKGNVTTDQYEILNEPLMVTMEFFKEYIRRFRHQSNVGFCFDTAHYGLMMESINALLHGHMTLDNERLAAEKFPPIYPGIIGQQPAVLDAAQQIMELGGRIFDMQLSDYGSSWQAKTTSQAGVILEEGLGLFEGRAGEEIIKLGKMSSNIPISFDIEVEDFMKPVKQVAALLMCIDYIYNEQSMNNLDEKSIVHKYHQKANKLFKS